MAQNFIPKTSTILYSSIPFGFPPQPETGSGTTLRPYREKEEVTTRAKKRALIPFSVKRCLQKIVKRLIDDKS